MIITYKKPLDLLDKKEILEIINQKIDIGMALIQYDNDIESFINNTEGYLFGIVYNEEDKRFIFDSYSEDLTKSERRELGESSKDSLVRKYGKEVADSYYSVHVKKFSLVYISLEENWIDSNEDMDILMSSNNEWVL